MKKNVLVLDGEVAQAYATIVDAALKGHGLQVLAVVDKLKSAVQEIEVGEPQVDDSK